MDSTTLTRTLFPVIQNGCFRTSRVKTSGNVFLGGGELDSRAVNSNKRAAQSKVVRMMVSDLGKKAEEKYPQNNAVAGLLGPLSDPDLTVTVGRHFDSKCFRICGGDDGARARNLCRDSEKEGRNLRKTSVTDGFFWRCKVRSGTVIEPISNP